MVESVITAFDEFLKENVNLDKEKTKDARKVEIGLLI